MKYKTIFISFALISSILFAQDVDEIQEIYLDSLPEGVREDVMDRMERKGEEEKPFYRAASTQLDKDQDEDPDLFEVFGQNFFDTIQTSFMPINEPNVGGSYILDYGDELEIQLLGQTDSNGTFKVNRDGSINIPEVGKIALSGLPLEEATSLIKAKVSDAYIGTEAFVSLTNIRDIRVIIAGNAYNPGIYTLNGSSNVLHALSMAGGLDEIGSFRNIQVIRNNEVVDTFDLYDVLIFGKNSGQSLRSGDSVLVNPRGIIASVETGVQRPGRYEMREGENLLDLIKFANGLSPNADKSDISMKMIDKGELGSKNISFEELSSHEISNGDTLFIKQYNYDVVKISGAIKNPGIYTLPVGTKLSELIDNAGGYEEYAYPLGGFLNNVRTYEINKISKDKLYENFLNNLIRSFKNEVNDRKTGLILEELRNSEVSGRIIAEFDRDVLLAYPDLDTVLEHEDEIFIPTNNNQVYVQGEVGNPGAVRYQSLEDIDFYLKNSGGTLKSADTKNIFVVHPNGTSESIEINSGVPFLNKNQILIYPGSIIYVPRSNFVVEGLEAAAIWAPIVSSIALSLTSLSVISND